jgi:hypothetical protein
MGKEDQKSKKRNQPTWVIVWNTPPATLCSCGLTDSETNIVPDANKKSAPTTLHTAAGKPKAQYGAEGTMSAKRSGATVVVSVPDAVPTVQSKCTIIEK